MEKTCLVFTKVIILVLVSFNAVVFLTNHIFCLSHTHSHTHFWQEEKNSTLNFVLS